LTRYRLLFLPWAMVVRPELAAALEAWVQSGGLLVAESEIAAFDAYGFYTYPEERAFPKALGVRGRGRRPVPEHGKIEVRFGGIHTNLTAASWIEPIETPGGTSIAIVGSETVGIARQLGSGSLIVLGTHAGLAYSRERSADFETYVRNVLTAGGVAPELTCSIANGEVVQFRHGCAGSKLLLFVTNEGEGVDAVFQWRGPARPAASSATDLLTGRHLHIEDDHNGAVSVAIRIDAGGSHLIVFDRR
jgi:beta-galactosidase